MNIVIFYERVNVVKKFLSTLLSVAILTLVCSVGVSAADSNLIQADENSNNAYSNLYSLYYCVYEQHTMTGIDRNTSSRYTWQRLNEAKALFSDGIQNTDDEYQEAFDNLLEAAYTEDVYLGYIKMTYEKALEEENFNNWYRDGDWSDFVKSRDAVGAFVENVDDIYCDDTDTEATKAFYSMLYQFNCMTHQYQKKGDVNKDGTVDIKDVTLVRRFLAGQENFTTGQKMLICYDTVEYENIDINSATHLQKYIAEMPNDLYTPFVEPFGDYYEDYDWRLARTYNFFICPRNLYLYPFDSYYYDTQYLKYFWLDKYVGPAVSIPRTGY